MKALTLTQPWATLVALGAKKVETRSWKTDYRGPLAIHAAKGMPRYALDVCFDPMFEKFVPRPSTLPRGMVIATVCLVRCIPTRDRAAVEMLEPQEIAFGDYTTGRWMWELADLEVLGEPVPAKGSLGLWDWMR